MCIRLVMDIEWDAAKAASNRKKHGVDFADAATALNDELSLTMPDEGSDEQRFVTLGMDATARLLVVVFTVRGDVMRLISARKATRSERRQYEERR